MNLIAKDCSEEVDYVPVFGTQVPEQENDLSCKPGTRGKKYLISTHYWPLNKKQVALFVTFTCYSVPDLDLQLYCSIVALEGLPTLTILMSKSDLSRFIILEYYTAKINTQRKI